MKGIVRVESRPTPTMAKGLIDLICAGKVSFIMQTKKFELRLMKNLAVKKKMRMNMSWITLLQVRQSCLLIKNWNKVKTVKNPNIVIIPTRLLSLGMIIESTGSVMNWDRPFMIPLRKMFENSLSSRRTGAYKRNIRIKNENPTLKKSVLKLSNRRRSIKVKKCAWSFLSWLSWYLSYTMVISSRVISWLETLFLSAILMNAWYAYSGLLDLEII